MENKKIFLVAFLISSGFGLSSCHDTQLGMGIGAVVGGIIGHHHYEDRNHHRHDYRGEHFLRTSDRTTMQAHEREDVRYVSQKYGLRYDVSEMIVDSLYQAQSQDYSGLQQMGLREQDLADLYNNQSLSQRALQQVSQNLNMTVADVDLMAQAMAADIQAERAQQTRQQDSQVSPGQGADQDVDQDRGQDQDQNVDQDGSQDQDRDQGAGQGSDQN